MNKKLGRFALPVVLFAFVGTAQAAPQLDIVFGEWGSPYFTTNEKVEYLDASLAEFDGTGFGSLWEATGNQWVASPYREGDWWLSNQPGYVPPSFSFTSTAYDFFNLDNLWLAGAYGSQTLTITGYANGVEVNTALVDITTVAQQYSFTGFEAIDTFTIAVDPTTFVGTTPNALMYWGMGSMTVTAVPEPETYAMLLAGLGLVGVMARRRQRR
ncbi:MAG: FxDxF family PEP-CTERM protein [Betaproteobacteria bacterium]|nr:FxDxF family PEP-CTERM protein [Betaproteobacteria bacterium]